MYTDLWKMGSGLATEPVLGPREARTRGRRPGMSPNWRFTDDRLRGGDGNFSRSFIQQLNSVNTVALRGGSTL